MLEKEFCERFVGQQIIIYGVKYIISGYGGKTYKQLAAGPDWLVRDDVVALEMIGGPTTYFSLKLLVYLMRKLDAAVKNYIISDAMKEFLFPYVMSGEYI